MGLKCKFVIVEKAVGLDEVTERRGREMESAWNIVNFQGKAG